LLTKAVREGGFIKGVITLLLLVVTSAQAEVIRYSCQGAAFDEIAGEMPAGLSAVSGYIEIDGGLAAGGVSDFPVIGGRLVRS
jgi:hypothetical protein